MDCLSIDRIYLFLEEEFPAKERESIKKHLSHCAKCSSAVEDRSFLLKAAQSLPQMEVPENFSVQIMENINSRKDTIWSPIIALISGFSFVVLSVFLFLTFSGKNPPGMFLSLINGFLSGLKTASVWLVKGIKIISALFELFWKLGVFLISGIEKFTHIVGIELLIFLIILTSAFYIFLFTGIKKKILSGE